jgi:hypothetical protein
VEEGGGENLALGGVGGFQVDSSSDALDGLITALKGMTRSIRIIEGTAYTSLHEERDEGSYRDKMREKAEVLRELPEAMAPFMDEMEQRERDAIEARLAAFARSAGTALKLGSVFYMSALLYPEDYTEGEPNDLERWIVELEQGRGRR